MVVGLVLFQVIWKFLFVVRNRMRGEKLNKDFPYYIDHKRIDVACVTDHPDSPHSVVFHARINATFASGALHWVVRDQEIPVMII